jgi:tetratricopeptide (TPR) repeat protein
MHRQNNAAALLMATLGAGNCGSAPASTPDSLNTAQPKTAQIAASDSCGAVLASDAATGSGKILQLQAMARKQPPSAAHLERLGWGFVDAARRTSDAGFYTLALQTADCIDSASPQATEALLLRSYALVQQHLFGQAESSARLLVSRRGSWMDQAVLGDALLEQGRLDDAVVAYQAMADQRPGPEAYARIAQVRYLTGDLPGAVEFMARAARANDAADSESAAWYRSRLALFALARGDTAEALALARSATALLPAFPPALAAQGRALLALHRYAEAAAVLQVAADATALPEHRWLLVEALTAEGDNRGAGLIDAHLRRDGAAADPRTLSLYLATRGIDTATAVRLAREELKQRADVLTEDALAWALHADGNDAAALAHAARAIALGTPDPRLWLHAGLIAEGTGDRRTAAKWLGRAARQGSLLLPSEEQLLHMSWHTTNHRTRVQFTTHTSHEEQQS